MLNILLLEDDPADAELICRALAHLGSVQIVSTRADFERVLEGGPSPVGPPVDVILADYNLPGAGLDGPQALEIALRKCPDKPFIFVSGTISHETAVAALKLGATDYVLKDSSMARLPAAIERACQDKRSQAQVAGIVHDLNNVLTLVMVALALMQPDLPSDKRQMLDAALANLRRAADMARQIITFRRGINCPHSPIDVATLIAQVADLVRSTFPKNIEVNQSVAKPLSTVHGNITQLHQVLLNFCVNARDAMPGGGSLYIGADEAVFSAYLPRTAALPISGLFVRIVVADEGCGMSEKTAAQIFQPFFTTKQKGHGLGLSTALSIARAHRGYIDLITREGRGCTFSLLLPAAPSTPDARPQTPDPSDAPC